MNSFLLPTFFILAVLCIGSTFYLLRCLTRDRQLLSLVGLFCLAMGLFLLVLDLLLITFTQGAQYIPDYLRFNRLVSDSGFAGRWVLTFYLFIAGGLAVSIYLLARNTRRKFNKKKSGEKSEL